MSTLSNARTQVVVPNYCYRRSRRRAEPLSLSARARGTCERLRRYWHRGWTSTQEVATARPPWQPLPARTFAR